MTEASRSAPQGPKRGVAMALALAAALSLPTPSALSGETAASPTRTSPSQARAVRERLGPERAAEREALFAALEASEREIEARMVEDRIWRFWFIAPNPEAEARMEHAVERMRVADYEAALFSLDRLVEEEPDWPEAWNQRALLRFLMERYDGSLEDILRVLELEPRHFGALSGQALILLEQGRDALALEALERAMAVNPFLKERHLLLRLKPKETPI